MKEEYIFCQTGLEGFECYSDASENCQRNLEVINAIYSYHLILSTDLHGRAFRRQLCEPDNIREVDGDAVEAFSVN
jgi:hypothetical protein